MNIITLASYPKSAFEGQLWFSSLYPELLEYTSILLSQFLPVQVKMAFAIPLAHVSIADIDLA